MYRGEFEKHHFVGEAEVLFPDGKLIHKGTFVLNPDGTSSTSVNQNSDFGVIIEKKSNVHIKHRGSGLTTDDKVKKRYNPSRRIYMGGVKVVLNEDGTKKYVKHGNGDQIFWNRGRFVGEFVDDKVHGYGAYYEKGSQEPVKGKWMTTAEGKVIQDPTDDGRKVRLFSANITPTSDKAVRLTLNID